MRTQGVVSTFVGLIGLEVHGSARYARFLSAISTLTFGAVGSVARFLYALLVVPLVSLSRLWLGVPRLRSAISVIGVPLAVIAFALTRVTVRDVDANVARGLFSVLWPYSVLWARLERDPAAVLGPWHDEFSSVLLRETGRVPAWRDYVAARGVVRRETTSALLAKAPTTVSDDDVDLDRSVDDLIEALDETLEETGRLEPQTESFPPESV